MIQITPGAVCVGKRADKGFFAVDMRPTLRPQFGE